MERRRSTAGRPLRVHEAVPAGAREDTVRPGWCCATSRRGAGQRPDRPPRPGCHGGPRSDVTKSVRGRWEGHPRSDQADVGASEHRREDRRRWGRRCAGPPRAGTPRAAVLRSCARPPGLTSCSADGYGRRCAGPGRPVAVHRPGGWIRPVRAALHQGPASTEAPASRTRSLPPRVCVAGALLDPASDRHPATRSCPVAGRGTPVDDEQGCMHQPLPGPAPPLLTARRTRPACHRGRSCGPQRRVPRRDRHGGAPGEPDGAGVRWTQSSTLGPPPPRGRSQGARAAVVGRLAAACAGGRGVRARSARPRAAAGATG
ncbi:hypothetical protein SAMN05660642_04898 [Geodermatophilus siccatus]|uniref:Uncharacterized protein n=1 Tax=Geodermatophilus siccatus TaxID=1137991 RepID=A0A1H0BN25_9ACTN|nr:hypothetical protein SAMN05660642_04898 [Geodermatophilus siccatus]